MRSDGMQQVRVALQSFCPTGAEKEAVTVPQLSEALGLAAESQRQILRRRLNDLIGRGEVKKLGRGLFVHIPGKEPHKYGESYLKMWRAVRIQQETFTISTVVQLTRVDSATVGRYLRFLEDEGFIRRAGKDGNTVLFRNTQKMREQSKTPYPPVDIADPYRAERIACAALHRLMLEDLNLPRIRQRICEQLSILVNSFNQPEKEET